jgi:hypothetical protein
MTTWQRIKATRPDVCALAEVGNVREAVALYSHGGAYCFSRTEGKKRDGAITLASRQGRSRNRTRAGIDAQIFFKAFRRSQRSQKSLDSSPVN